MPTTAETIAAFQTFLSQAPASELRVAAVACDEQAHRECLAWIRRRDAGGKGVKADMEAISRRADEANAMAALIRSALRLRGEADHPRRADRQGRLTPHGGHDRCPPSS